MNDGHRFERTGRGGAELYSRLCTLPGPLRGSAASAVAVFSSGVLHTHHAALGLKFRCPRRSQGVAYSNCAHAFRLAMVLTSVLTPFSVRFTCGLARKFEFLLYQARFGCARTAATSPPPVPREQTRRGLSRLRYGC